MAVNWQTVRPQRKCQSNKGTKEVRKKIEVKNKGIHWLFPM